MLPLHLFLNFLILSFLFTPAYTDTLCCPKGRRVLLRVAQRKSRTRSPWHLGKSFLLAWSQRGRAKSTSFSQLRLRSRVPLISFDSLSIFTVYWRRTRDTAAITKGYPFPPAPFSSESARREISPYPRRENSKFATQVFIFSCFRFSPWERIWFSLRARGIRNLQEIHPCLIRRHFLCSRTVSILTFVDQSQHFHLEALMSWPWLLYYTWVLPRRGQIVQEFVLFFALLFALVSHSLRYM